MRENLLVSLEPEHYHRYVTRGTDPWNRYLVQRLQVEISEVTTASPAVLDIGMGTGHMLIALAVDPNFACCSLAGLDIDPGMVQLACKETTYLNLQSRLSLTEGDVHNMPYNNGSMDIVFGRSVVHHWANPIRAFAEIYRVLAPGGRVVIHEPLRDPEISALALFNADRRDYGVNCMTTAEKYTVPEIEAQIAKSEIKGRIQVVRGEGATALGCEIYIVKPE